MIVSPRLRSTERYAATRPRARRPAEVGLTDIARQRRETAHEPLRPYPASQDLKTLVTTGQQVAQPPPRCYGCSYGRPGQDGRLVSYRKGFTLKGFAFQRRKLVSLSVAALAIGASYGFTANAVAATSGTLNGAGAALVAPLEAEWAAGFNSRTGNTVNYNAVGSGTGITDISHGLVDFGASDAPLTSSQASGCANCIQIPWALSAT